MGHVFFSIMSGGGSPKVCATTGGGSCFFEKPGFHFLRPTTPLPPLHFLTSPLLVTKGDNEHFRTLRAITYKKILNKSNAILAACLHLLATFGLECLAFACKKILSAKMWGRGGGAAPPHFLKWGASAPPAPPHPSPMNAKGQTETFSKIYTPEGNRS